MGTNEIFNRNLFATVAADNHIELKKLLDAGTDPNTANTAGETLLLYACYWDSPSCVMILLRYGADINFRDTNGETALMLSCQKNIKCMELLLEAGADINIRNKWGETALIKACGWGNTIGMTLLLAAGADPNTWNDYFECPIIILAAMWNRHECMEILIRAGQKLDF